MIDIYNFIQTWFQNDLALVGTILITVVAAIVFLYEIIQKVKKDKKLEAILFFIAYLITLFGLILIILQSLHNIQTTQKVESRLDKIEHQFLKSKIYK